MSQQPLAVSVKTDTSRASSPEQSDAQMESIYASQFGVLMHANDATINFLKTNPVVDGNGQLKKVLNIPVVSIAMSFSTIKDLSIALSQTIAQFEAANGEISTPFMKHLAKAQPTATK